MPCVAVAYSGGRDSTALLHAVACAAREAGLDVAALHVHHGLSVHADAWLDHAQATCDAWAAQGLPVRLLWRRVVVPQGAGLSLEAEARTLRHAALQDMAGEAEADLLLLAHHRRDQAETLLLQALRGGGVAGLAAMPRDDWRGGVRWVRPWLDHPREAIEAYVAQHGLSHVDDESNGDPRFARNRLRLLVWPALLAAFPRAEAALATSAERLADALEPLRDWQAQALDDLALADDQAALDVPRWAAWSPARRREALRHWYARASGRTLPSSWVMRLADELPHRQAAAEAGQGPGAGVWPELGLSFYRGRLRWASGLGVCEPPPRSPTGDAGEGRGLRSARLAITGPGDWPLPAWGGVLRVEACTRAGVAPGRLAAASLAWRAGGEQFQAGLLRPPRALKKQFQSLGVPAWERNAPLLWDGAQLLFVPGLGVDARAWAPEGQPQWALSWQRLSTAV